jgi:PAS domain-containing protein
MNRHLRFLKNTLDTLSDEVVVISQRGDIVYANQAWVDFGNDNGCQINDWQGLNYLAACERAEADGNHPARCARQAIQAVLSDEDVAAYMEYPCHAPDSCRRYRMVVTGFESGGTRYGVVLHRYVSDEDLADDDVAWELERPLAPRFADLEPRAI